MSGLDDEFPLGNGVADLTTEVACPYCGETLDLGAREMAAMKIGPADFVIGIATSGTTPFVHGALEYAAEQGASTGFLLCTPPDPELRARYDVVIAPLVGPEVITGSTRMKAVEPGSTWGHHST